jgi:glycosyltransferase involved in cell wall biosynthesis
MISPPFYAVPPKGYGGIQTHIHHLCRGLENAGHAVKLFASGDSTCRVSRIGHFYDVATLTPSGKTVPELTQVLAAYRWMESLEGGVDLIHDHTFIGPHLAPRLSRVPVVTTFHDVGDDQRSLIYSALPEEVATICISDHQRSALSPLSVDQRIYPGLDVGEYSVSTERTHLLFLGRFSPEKGAETAIEVACKAGLPIVLAGRIVRGQEDYFERCIRPQMSDQVSFVGEVSGDEKHRYLSQSIALINAIKYDEPFGLVNIEAHLSGVPVISYRLGALPEIVSHGRNGFFCANVAEAVEAVRACSSLDPEAIRNEARLRFSVERMTEEHIDFYKQVLSRS